MKMYDVAGLKWWNRLPTNRRWEMYYFVQ